MKKIISVLAGAAMAMSLVGCSSGSSKSDFDPIAEFGSDELYVFNVGEYIDEENITKFEEKYNVTVYYKTYDSNEEMYTAIVGGDKYDIVVPSDYMVTRLINEGLVQELDLSLIPNAANLTENLQSPEYDPDHTYSIPYFQGSVGICYDTTKFTLEELEEQGWNILKNTDYAGEIAMYDADRDNFLPAMKALGYSMNTTNDDEIQACYEWLLEQKELVNPAYVTDEINDIMIDGGKTLAVVYSGAAAYIMAENEDMGYFEPLEGTNVWSDAMCIPSTSENVKLAHAWINFMLEEDVAEANAIAVGYTSNLQSVIDKLTAEGGEFEGNSAYIPVQDMTRMNPITMITL